jgi:hypothetical protein
MGMAMGSPMAPSYASLFIGKLEKDFLQNEKFIHLFGLDF